MPSPYRRGKGHICLFKFVLLKFRASSSSPFAFWCFGCSSLSFALSISRLQGEDQLVNQSFEGKTEWLENSTLICGIVTINVNCGLGCPLDSSSLGASTVLSYLSFRLDYLVVRVGTTILIVYSNNCTL